MKVSLYLDDELWSRFKRSVLRQTGDPRSLSAKVQGLIQNSMTEESLARGFQKMNIAPTPLDSGQVVPVRPSVDTSAGREVRQMRESRHAERLPR
ncbi:MAG: hypothetical protein JRN08_06975 [Nitrososphaerota archaeon]|nr:hypothetical protein [Nitrososphaerota archaeon]